MSIAYSECVFVHLGILHAMRMRYVVICDLSGSAIFFHITTARFSVKEVTDYKMYLLIFCTSLSENFPILRRIRREVP